MVNGGDITLRSSGDGSSHNSSNRYVLVGVSSLFRAILDVVDAVADKDCPVLIEGESGTGKELVARRIHAKSKRNSKPFIPVNCPATTETLFESQFYGHVKGAFTGAASDTLGVVRAAEGGTLLLDEVGELPLHLQPKLLRLLQERTRPEDIDPLVDHYLRHYAREYNAPQRELSPRLKNCLREYSWPGNIRELCGYIERLYATGQPAIAPSSVAWQDGYISHTDRVGKPDAPKKSRATSIPTTLADAEAQAIEQALEAAGYNRTAAAKILNIHRSTLIRRLRTLGLDKRS